MIVICTHLIKCSGIIILCFWHKMVVGEFRLSFTGVIAKFVCVLAILFSCTPFSLALADSDANDRVEQLQKLRGNIKQLQKTLLQDKGEKNELVQQLRKIEVQVGGVSNRIRKLNKKNKLMEKKLSQLQADYKKQAENLSGQKDILSKQVVAAYAMGRQEYLKLLLNQHDPAMVARTFVYYDYLNEARTEKIDQVTLRLQNLVNLKREINSQLELISKNKKSLMAEKQSLNKTRRVREKLLTEIQKRIKNQGSKLKGMQLDEKQLLTLVQELQNALSDIPAQLSSDIRKQKGKMKLPVKGYVAKRFGSSKGSGQSRWKGVFIKAKEGNNVRSFSHGRVVFSDWFKGLGLLMIVDHGDGYMSLYGHNQSLFKDAGDWVDAGDIIAAVGNTGGNRDSGLYFEIRVNGKPQDPIAWCRR